MNGTTIKRVEKGISDLRTARNKAKLTQEALAALIGTKRENISTWESGTKGLTLKTAKRLSEHLDTSPGELLTANRLSEYKKAKSAGDAAGALLAIKGLIEGVGDEDLTPEGERFLDDLADEALEFAGMGPGSKSASPNEEVFGYEETRDPAGRRVSKAKAAESRQTGIWPSMGGGFVLPDPEDYDPIGHDGRNLHGHRIAPLPDEDELENVYEEEE